MKRLIVVAALAVLVAIAIQGLQSARSIVIPDTVVEELMSKAIALRDTSSLVGQAAPITMSGNNSYIAWWSNETADGSNDVMFRVSTDGGETFGEKINLSNSTNSNSTRVDMDSDGDNVVVSWWETNETDDNPVMRVSNDNGTTFGPILKLATNGSISGSGGGIGNG
jgi:type II secretory pathway pseudopilin PulG